MQLCSKVNLVFKELKEHHKFTLAYIFSHFKDKIGEITLVLNRKLGYNHLTEAMNDCLVQPTDLVIRNEYFGASPYFHKEMLDGIFEKVRGIKKFVLYNRETRSGHENILYEIPDHTFEHLEELEIHGMNDHHYQLVREL